MVSGRPTEIADLTNVGVGEALPKIQVASGETTKNKRSLSYPGLNVIQFYAQDKTPRPKRIDALNIVLGAASRVTYQLRHVHVSDSATMVCKLTVCYLSLPVHGQVMGAQIRCKHKQEPCRASEGDGEQELSCTRHETFVRKHIELDKVGLIQCSPMSTMLPNIVQGPGISCCLRSMPCWLQP